MGEFKGTKINASFIGQKFDFDGGITVFDFPDGIFKLHKVSVQGPVQSDFSG